MLTVVADVDNNAGWSRKPQRYQWSESDPFVCTYFLESTPYVLTALARRACG